MYVSAIAKGPIWGQCKHVGSRSQTAVARRERVWYTYAQLVQTPPQIWEIDNCILTPIAVIGTFPPGESGLAT